jgi:hypothetical protein
MPTNKQNQIHLAIEDKAETIYRRAIPAQWHDAARRKGYAIAARVSDRYHVALRCNRCGGLTKTKVFVLMNNQPICGPCLSARQRSTARRAGLTMLRRDPRERHYAVYRGPCGHELRRQFELVERAARGEVAVRCDVCLGHRDDQTASGKGWRPRGAHPAGCADYRLYEHVHCGTLQSVARVNMTTGRFTCQGCGQGWSREPICIYRLQVTLGDGTRLLKIGFSRDPIGRATFQLRRDPAVTIEVSRVVQFPSGREALRREQRLHAIIREELPIMVAPPELFADALKVSSEVYFPAVRARIDELLDADDQSRPAAYRGWAGC